MDGSSQHEFTKEQSYYQGIKRNEVKRETEKTDTFLIWSFIFTVNAQNLTGETKKDTQELLEILNLYQPTKVFVHSMKCMNLRLL